MVTVTLAQVFDIFDPSPQSFWPKSSVFFGNSQLLPCTSYVPSPPTVPPPPTVPTTASATHHVNPPLLTFHVTRTPPPTQHTFQFELHPMSTSTSHSVRFQTRYTKKRGVAQGRFFVCIAVTFDSMRERHSRQTHTCYTDFLLLLTRCRVSLN